MRKHALDVWDYERRQSEIDTRDFICRTSLERERERAAILADCLDYITGGTSASRTPFS